MAQTFIAKADTSSTYVSTTYSPTVSTIVDENPMASPLVLYNTTGSNSIVRIRRISVTPKSFTGTTPNTQNLVPITSYSGGDTQGAFKLDSASASLPSTVEIRGNVYSAVLGTGSLVRVNHFPSNLLGVTVGYPFGKNNLLNKWKDATTSEYQKFSLRNGEGLALYENNNHVSYSYPIVINAVIRLSDTGACYGITSYVNAGCTHPFVIYNNGYTAGQVELLSFKTEASRANIVLGTTDWEPMFQIMTLESFNPRDSAEVITTTSLDSSNTLNSYIKVYKNADIGYFIARAGSLATVANINRLLLPTSRGATPLLTSIRQDVFSSKTEYTDIVIREGSGIALSYSTSVGTATSFDFEMLFTQESTTAGAVYPAVGDVDLSVTYGPTGADYTGTLEQPAITDVLSGVQYGAGGTEFTGTATGGGGGETSHVF